ncbi:hypothetical protein [Pseudotabrizicola formosa]|uniref:hypothetical protein n=1 Tax=Pseudotabrizicola formosa TaxID=2030009 RepID=UPI000CD0D148|nr:hypothetical protein [Pseudotabrizicola formosa]
MTGAVVARLPDGRMHLQHGPIDIIAQAWGDAAAVAEGERLAATRFGSVLAELAAELPVLRREAGQPTGSIGQKMAQATAAFAPRFITPMAAVAGAVADAVLSALAIPGVTRAYVNNGGDIALHLIPGESLTCAIATQPGWPDRLTLRAEDAVRGIATSGWRGRSWSLGIADSVTVLGRTAAMADAAATMIANAVDLPGHPGICRRPAVDLQADSDLGTRPVTVAVARLSAAEVAAALAAGSAAAESFRRRGLIEAAALFLQSETRVIGPVALKEPALV